MKQPRRKRGGSELDPSEAVSVSNQSISARKTLRRAFRTEKPAATSSADQPAPAVDDKDESEAARHTREEMIRAAAYHRAAQRGFAPGAELEDWLAAEAEVDAKLRARTASLGAGTEDGD
jgi:hypothetical protein